MDYEIFSDVSLDIDREFARKHQVRYVPMEYMLEEQSFRCTEPESDSMMHEYYEKLRRKASTHTSQITPNHYLEVFKPYVKEGRPLLYISLSSGLSNTYGSACMAAQMLREDYTNAEIEVVDSLGGTGGMGLLVEKACENRESGMSLTENAEWLRKHAGNISYWFKVEDLMYLQRGGRVSAATAVVGTALQIKPILTILPNGKLDTIEKKRGNKQALKCMAERFGQKFDPSYGNTVYISCSDCMDVADSLKKLVLEQRPDANVKKTMLSPIIGAHTGPDMVALIYFSTER